MTHRPPRPGRTRPLPAHEVSPLHDERLPAPEVTETDCERVWAEFQRLRQAAEADFPPTQPLVRPRP